MNRNILIVEDDDQIRKIIKDYFEMNQFQVYEAEDGEKALEIFDSNRINLVILDIMLPKLDGWSICRRIREHSDVPIIMLTARTDDTDQLLGFELGADEYVTKPFSYKVLVARAKALLNRVEGSQKAESVVIEGIEIDLLAYTVKVDGEMIDLAPKEYAVLIYLIENKNIVIKRDKILDEVWGYDYTGDDRAVDTYIKKIRKKLGRKGSYIKTVTGVGYKFEVF